MTRTATKSTASFHAPPARPATAALPSFVMVGDEKVTKPQEVAFVLLLRSLPEEHRSAAVRFIKSVASGTSAREAGVAYWTETGGAPEDGERVADAVLASMERAI